MSPEEEQLMQAMSPGGFKFGGQQPMQEDPMQGQPMPGDMQQEFPNDVMPFHGMPENVLQQELEPEMEMDDDRYVDERPVFFKPISGDAVVDKTPRTQKEAELLSGQPVSPGGDERSSFFANMAR